MSVPDLSDDMRGWPADPFALLGVERGGSDTDLKRAYTRLVRRFKPEHHPDQFRRIREAYEACLDQAPWHRYDRPAGPAPDGPPDPPEQSPRPPSAAAAASPKPRDPVEVAWDSAVTGDPDAYANLARLSDTVSGPDVCLRLYWLLAVRPPLDPGRTRHHWLAEAVVRSGLRGPAAELYRRELEADPAALGAGYDRLLTATADPAALLTISRWRLAAAGRTNGYGRILADLTALRSTLPPRDEPGWLGLLTAAAGWAAWGNRRVLDQFLQAEVTTLAHLQLSCGPLFDRLEENEAVAKDVEWGRFNAVPPAVVRLLQVGWADAGYARPVEVEAAADALLGWKGLLLERLDATFVNRTWLLAVVAREFDHYRRTRHPAGEAEYPPDLIRGLARRLGLRLGAGYPADRPAVLDLLTAHAVDPLEFAAACASDPSSLVRACADILPQDLGLRVAWLAARVVGG